MSKYLPVILLIFLSFNRIQSQAEPTQDEILAFGVYFLSAFVKQDFSQCLPSNLNPQSLHIMDYPTVQLYLLTSSPTLTKIVIYTELAIDVFCEVKKELTDMSSSGKVGDPTSVLANANSALTKSQTKKDQADQNVLIDTLYLEICKKINLRRLWGFPIPIPNIPIPPIPNPLDILKKKVEDFISGLSNFTQEIKDKAVQIYLTSDHSISTAQDALNSAQNLARLAVTEYNSAQDKLKKLKNALNPVNFDEFKNIFDNVSQFITQTIKLYVSTIFKNTINEIKNIQETCQSTTINFTQALEDFAELILNLNSIFNKIKSGTGLAGVIMNLICEYKDFMDGANSLIQAFQSTDPTQKLAFLGKGLGIILRAVALAA